MAALLYMLLYDQKKLREHWKPLFDIDKVDLVKKDGQPRQLINKIPVD
jgi:hypothetical protein